jgi:hypothetical protein
MKKLPRYWSSGVMYKVCVYGPLCEGVNSVEIVIGHGYVFETPAGQVIEIYDHEGNELPPNWYKLMRTDDVEQLVVISGRIQ